MKKLLSLLMLFASISLFAQDFKMDLVQDLKPRNIGPGGMSGRVTAIDVVNNSPEVMYVGTASGGVWKSTSGGIKWEPIFDKEVTASIGALAIQQSNPSVIWVGTGEGNPRNSLNGGYGVYRSLDGGKNWKSMGLEKTRHIHRIKIDPTDPNTIYVGAIGSPWGEHAERGVFKTTNGGETWEKILFVNNKTGVADLIMDPTNPNKLIAALWEHKRDPWFFKSGGKGSGLHITHDGGKSWKKITEEDGLPKGELGRIGIAIAPSKPNIVYALVEAKKNALYKSEDGGYKWKKVNDKPGIGNRPFYYSEIYVNPQNENRLYTVYTYVNVSQDGGKSFTELMPAYGVDNGVHPDHHAWWIHPDNGEYMVNGNDGGLNITRDGGKSWRFIGNLPVAQFYHINTDNEFPYNVYGGMQDNGSWRGPAYVWKSQGIRNSYWQEISFGDGFDVVPDKEDSRYGYTMSQQGFVQRYDHVTGNNYIVRPTPPDAKTKLRFNWNAAIGQDPFDNNTAYFGSQFVHKTTDKGLTWKVISPDLTSNDPEKQKQSESGGLTMDATGAENHCTILVIEPSPVEKDMLWTGSDDGLIHITKDGGQNWNNVTPPNLKEGIINSIEVSPHDPATAYAVVMRYKSMDLKPYIYKTTNYGTNWYNITNGISGEHTFVRVVREDKRKKGLLYAGTETGLFISTNDGQNWQPFQLNLPVVPINDLIIQDNDLVVATAGRSFWILDDVAAIQNIETPKQAVTIFEPKESYLIFGGSTDKLVPGLGQNPKSGITFDYFLEKEADSLDLTLEVIYNGDVIRKITNKKPKDFKSWPGGPSKPQVLPSKKGYNRFTWNFRKETLPAVDKVFVYGSYAGSRVGPGNYTLRLTLDGLTSETEATVLANPKVESSTADYTEQQGVLEQIEGAIKNIHESVTLMRSAKAQLKGYSKLLKANDEAKDLLEKGKELTKRIDTWEQNLVQPNQKTFQDVINFNNQLNAEFMELKNYVDAAEPKVTKGAKERLSDLMADWKVFETERDAIVNKEMQSFNSLYKELGLSAIILNKK